MIQNTNLGVSKTYVNTNIGVWNWLASHSYDADDLVAYQGTIYKSLESNNQNNVPSASSLVWELYDSDTVPEYNCIMNYSVDNNTIVCSYAGTLAGAIPAKVTGTTPNSNSFINKNIGWMKEVYVCTLDEDGNERHILNPYDLTKDIYGADMSSEIQTYDVMVHMPDCYLYETDGTVAINSDAKYGGHRLAHTYGGVEKHDLYIAMFPTSIGADGKSHSFSGVTATTSRRRDEASNGFRLTTRNKNVNTTGWHNIKWHEFKLIQAMMFQAIASANAQTAIGRGVDSGGQSAIATNGALNNVGWFGGDTTSGANPVKLIIENPWANRWCFIDDCVADSGANTETAGHSPIDGVYYADFYAGTNAENLSTASSSGINDTLTDKSIVGQVFLGSSASAAPGGQYITGIDTSSTGWGIPKTVGGGSGTYFCDGMWANGSRQDLCLVGGDSHYGLICGLFTFGTSAALSASAWAIGSRLAYIK